MVELVSDYYEQDLVKPTAIYHGFDFGDRRDDGSFMKCNLQGVVRSVIGKGSVRCSGSRTAGNPAV